MTAETKFKEFLEVAGLKPEIDQFHGGQYRTGGEYYRKFIKSAEQYTRYELTEGDPKVIGYSCFGAEFIFDSKGDLSFVGIWE